jgi:DNA-binding LytR/AlgR family response regulator
LNGQRYTITRTLKWFVLQLPDFVRLHKSTLANPVHVTGCQRQQSRSALVMVRIETSFPVARRRVDLVVKSLRPT